jgi:hypothetical protein
MYNYSLAGAILSELLLQDIICVSEDKDKIVTVVHSNPLGDPIMDEVLSQISQSSKPRNLQYWVTSVAGLKDLAHRIAEQLSELAIVAKEQGKFLWLFTRKIWPEIDGSYENSIRQRMAAVMFFEDVLPDDRTAVLIALAKSCHVLDANFASVELKQHTSRIKQICEGKLLAVGATLGAIAAVQAAMTAATMAASIAASSAAR